MLIALITSFIISLFSADMTGREFIESLEKQIKIAISEKEHKKELTTLVDAMEREMKTFHKKLNMSGKELSKLNKNYTSTREDFENVLNELNETRMVTQQNVLKIRFKLKESMTKEEWKMVFDSMSSQEKE